MSRCINVNHPAFQELLAESKLSPLELELKVAAWQDTNDSDLLPSFEELSRPIANNKEPNNNTSSEPISTLDTPGQVQKVEEAKPEDGQEVNKETEVSTTTLFNKETDPERYEQAVIKYLQEKGLVNYKREAHTIDGKTEQYYIVRRYEQGTYDVGKETGNYVMYDNIHKLNDMRIAVYNKNGYFPFNVKELANNKVAVIVNKEGALFNDSKTGDSSSEAFIRGVADKLSARTGIQYEFVSEEQARGIVESAGQEYNGEGAFFHEHKVYFVEGKLSKESALHEFAHPFILALKADNKALYKKLTEVINSSEDPTVQAMITHVKENYPANQQQDEIFVRVLTQIGQGTINLTEARHSGLRGAIERFIFWIKQTVRSLFPNKTLDISSLSLDTTLDELADLLYNGKQDLDLSEHKSDYVLFNKPLADEFKQMENSVVTKNIKIFHDALLGTLNRLSKGDFMKLKEAIENPEGGNSFRSGFSLINNAQDLENDINMQYVKLRSFAEALLHVKAVSSKMAAHVKDMANDPNISEKDKLVTLVNYMYIVSDWEGVLGVLKTDKGDLPLIGDEINRILDNFDKIHDFKDSLFKKGLTSVFSKQLAPIKARADVYFPAEIARLEAFNDPKLASRINWLKSMQNKFNYTDENILKYMEGLMGDTNPFSALLEGYSGSPDPIVGSFANFMNDALYGVEAWLFSFRGDLTHELAPLYKELGIDRSNPERMGKKITQDDIIPTTTTDGKIEGFNVHTLLHPFAGGWLHDYRVEEQKVEDAVKAKDKDAIRAARQAFEDWKAIHFVREYKQSVYDIKNYWHSSPIAQKAYDARKLILDELKIYADATTAMTPEDIEDKDRLEKELQTLSSIKNLDGTEKDTEGKDIALAIQEYYKKSKGLYDEFEIKGMFDTTLKQREIELEQKHPRDSEEFKKARNAWIRQNLRFSLSDEFYDTRKGIIDEIDAILSHLDNDVKKKLQISTIWEEIINQVKGFRDQDNQPIGTELSAEKTAEIKKHEEKIQEIRATFRKMTGLTLEDEANLQTLWDVIKDKRRLDKDQQNQFDSLMNQKTAYGLDATTKVDLFRLFDELEQLSGKMPTDYYINTINEVMKANGMKEEISYANAEQFLYAENVEPLLDDNPEFKKWFLANHIIKYKYIKGSDETGRDSRVEKVYQRLYTWNRIIPNEPELKKILENADYEKLLEYKSPYLNIRKARKYYYYRIKNEHKTGYDSVTGKVNLVVGKHIDNRGNWLPKTREQWQADGQDLGKDMAKAKYLSKKYYQMKDSKSREDQAYLKIAEVYAKYHLKIQDGIPTRNRLYMEVPRMRKERIEIVQEGLRNKGGVIKDVMGWAKSLFSPHKEVDEFDQGLAGVPDQEKILVMTDIFGNEATSIPIKYMSRIVVDLTSYDVGMSIMRYAASARTSKALHDVNPVAKALVSVLEENGIKAINKISILARFNPAMNIIPKLSSNTRLKAIQNMIERDIQGVENKMEFGEGSVGIFANKMAKQLMSLAAFGSMAINIPGHVKNLFAARIQNTLESITGEHYSARDYLTASGEFIGWCVKMASDYNKLSGKSLQTLIMDAFDPVQGRFMETLGKEFNASIMTDTVNMRWPTAGQQFGEIEAQGTAMLAMMKATRVPVTQADNTVRNLPYDKVWTTDNQGKLVTIPGVPDNWKIGGTNFITFKKKMQMVNQLLQGAYAKMNQPEASRYTTFKLTLFMRRYFVSGFVNRFAPMRPNVALGGFREGYYASFVRNILQVPKTGLKTWTYMSSLEKRQTMRTLAEIGYSLVFLGLLMLLGYNDSDKDRYKKLKENDWAINMLIYQLLLVKGEAETFIPLPGMGIDELLRIKDSPSIAFPLINKYYKVISHLLDAIRDPFVENDLTHYQRGTGIYEKGDLKLMADLFKIIGYSGYTKNPAAGIKAYSQAMNRYR